MGEENIAEDPFPLSTVTSKIHNVFTRSAVPESQQCRDEEYSLIVQFQLTALPRACLTKLRDHPNSQISDACRAVLDDTLYPPGSTRVEVFPSVSCGKCLYVTGAPGTGKTLSVGRAVEELGLKDMDEVKYIYVNAMNQSRGSLINTIENNIKNIRSSVKRQLKDQQLSVTCKDISAFPCAPTYSFGTVSSPSFTPTGDFGVVSQPTNSVVVVVDEVDSLIQKDAAAVQELFSLPYMEYSKLWIVAISNTSEQPTALVESRKRRFVQRPSVLVYQRYDAAALAKVLTCRVRAVCRELQQWCSKSRYHANTNYLLYDDEHQQAQQEDGGDVKRRRVNNSPNGTGSRRTRFKNKTQIDVDKPSVEITEDMVTVLSERMIHPAAIVMTARQVASRSSDVRQGLEILRLALDCVGLLDVDDAGLRQFLQLSTALVTAQDTCGMQRAPYVHIRDVVNVVSSHFQPLVKRLQAVPVQQQAVLVAAAFVQQAKGTAAVGKKLIFSTCTLLTKYGVPGLSENNFTEAFDTLVHVGAFSQTQGSKDSYVYGQTITIGEIHMILEGNPVFEEVLQKLPQ